jgi:L-serine dehydratase
MAISVFDMFSIGLGPSSSHAVGPMRAARRFACSLEDAGEASAVTRVKVELFGSLGHTGKGHGSDKAVVLGLQGERPETVDVDRVDELYDAVESARSLALLGSRPVAFSTRSDLVFHKRQSLPGHPNGMRFSAYAGESLLRESVYYSIGGGFVIDEAAVSEDRLDVDRRKLPHGFGSGAELLAACHETGYSISTLQLENEKSLRSEPEVRAGLLELWVVMEEAIRIGSTREGVLPGGMKLKRRAPAVARKLKAAPRDTLSVMDHVNLYALAVSEQNAAGGRIVTAPTNGAAGIIPAVLAYHQRFVEGADEDCVMRFLLAAGAVGILYLANASISGAEVGCQGEVGVACSMAAAGLAEVLGGTPEQVENAAEIGMEHNLGLTCDPIGGLVQVPCIERNAMGAVKAINAARLALQGDGKHHVSLDGVIETMRQTGADMKTKYKETARGGLAVNIIEC